MNPKLATPLLRTEEQIPSTHGICYVTGLIYEVRWAKGISLPWPEEIYFRKGSPRRLAGVTVLHDFDWRTQFGHSQGAFPNGEYLTRFVKQECPDDRSPVLLLTKLSGIVTHSFDLEDKWSVIVVNIDEFLKHTAASPAVDFFASRFTSRITRIVDIEEGDIASWAMGRPDRIAKLGDIANRLSSTGSPAPATADDLKRVLETIAKIDGEVIDQVLDLFHKGGVEADFVLRRLLATGNIDDISEALDWLLEGDNRKIAKQFSKLQVSSLQRLNSIAGLTALERAWDIWQTNRTNSTEEFWQQQLQEHSFVLSQICTHPIVLIQNKAYVGGKGIDNKHGNIVDFLCKNQHTHNVVLVEIKTPCTQLLLNTPYRGDAYNIGPEISGATIQVATQRAAFMKSCNELSANSEKEFVAHQPLCIIIAGNTDQLTSERHVKSFELYRRSLTGIEILTFDELFARVRSFIDVFGSSIQPSPEDAAAPIPSLAVFP